MALKLPTLPSSLPIVDTKQRPTKEFQLWWQTVVRAIEAQEATQDELIANQAIQLAAIQALQSQQAESIAALTAQQAQMQAIINALYPLLGESGSSAFDVTMVISGAWYAGPLVPLTGVVAGTLTMAGSMELAGAPSGGDSFGEWRLVETVGASDTVLTTGNWHTTAHAVYDPEFPYVYFTYTNDSAAAVSAYSAARTSTGSVSYRADFRITSGVENVTLNDVILNVVRAT